MSSYHNVLNSLSTAVLVFGPDKLCVYANEACQTLLLKSQVALSGRGVEAILGPNDKLVEQCHLAREHGQRIVLREIEFYLPDWQRHLLVDLTITACHQEHGVEMILELNDRKEVQKLTQDTDMMARFKVATQIVRGLAHEIKNPLGGIRGAAQLLALEFSSPETEEYMSVITQEVDRLSALLSRMSSGHKSPDRSKVDIHEPITQVASLLSAENGNLLEFRYNFDTSLPGVEVNFDQIKQVLLNMMKNAAQWALTGADKTPSERPCALVSIRTRAVYPDPRRSLMPQRGVRIQVQDNGPGVDELIVDQLFLPMVTCREGGTGLGLSISQEIAQSHDGYIELDEHSKSGGASFSFYLPYSPLEADSV